MDVLPHPPNPDYGNAIYRRAIRLTSRPGETIGELEDSEHALRCRLIHDGARVISLSADFSRYPMTTCPRASSLLADFDGLALDTPLAWFYGEGRLLARLASGAWAGSRALVDHVRGDVAQFAHGAPQADDITLLALRFRADGEMARTG